MIKAKLRLQYEREIYEQVEQEFADEGRDVRVKENYLPKFNDKVPFALIVHADIGHKSVLAVFETVREAVAAKDAAAVIAAVPLPALTDGYGQDHYLAYPESPATRLGETIRIIRRAAAKKPKAK